jgi:AcrR family transcriptional regulator
MIEQTLKISTAERLPTAAAELFREKGYAQSTTRELAERLGVQKASLYHHIRTKEDLLYAICTESLARLTAAVQAAIAAAPEEERLHAAMTAHVTAILRDRDMHSTMLLELRSLSEKRRRQLVKARDGYERLLQDLVEADQAAGRCRTDVTSRLLTLAMLNLMNWTIVWFDPEGRIGLEEFGSLLATLFEEGTRLPVSA